MTREESQRTDEGCGKCVTMGAARVCECHDDHEGRERNALVRRINELDKKVNQLIWCIVIMALASILHVISTLL